jgi:hypothetical protein
MYQCFLILLAGGDWGSFVCKALGLYHGSNCRLIHLNLVFAKPLTIYQKIQGLAATLMPSSLVSALGLMSLQEVKDVLNLLQFNKYETAYQEIQGTKPRTFGACLSDSPFGLLAWLYDKYYLCGGFHEGVNAFSDEEILDQITLYWLTNTIETSFILYKDSLKSPEFECIIDAYCKTPTAVSRFPRDILLFPKSWVQSKYNVVWWKRHASGGHFPAMECPKEYCQDVVEVGQLRFNSCPK